MSYLGSPPNKLTTTTVITNDLTVDTNTLIVDSALNNVGIGTSSPSHKLHVDSASTNSLLIEGAGTRQLYSYHDSDGVGWFTDSGASLGEGIYLSQAGSNLRLYTNASERMRIDASGNVLVGTTSQIEGSRVCISATNGLGINVTGAGGGALNANYVSTGTGYFGYFKYGGAVVGSITSTGSSTAYNTSSDYRLKENVVTITDGIERVKQLNPSRFNFISNADTTVDGFIAHEVQSIVPEAITGEKDAVDEDGNPEYQGIDQAKLVPLLTAALQEAITKLETLEARVAALENV